MNVFVFLSQARNGQGAFVVVAFLYLFLPLLIGVRFSPITIMTKGTFYASGRGVPNTRTVLKNKGLLFFAVCGQ